MKRVSLVVTLALAAGLSAQAASAQTLKTVKDRGMLSCGVSQGLPGFSTPDDKGNWTGLDVDITAGASGAPQAIASSGTSGPASWQRDGITTTRAVRRYSRTAGSGMKPETWRFSMRNVGCVLFMVSSGTLPSLRIASP